MDSDMSDLYSGDTGPDPEYRHTLDWRETSLDTVTESTVNISAEPLLVRASFRYLSSLGSSLWGDFLISRPERRLEAARWLASQIAAVDTVLRREQV